MASCGGEHTSSDAQTNAGLSFADEACSRSWYLEGALAVVAAEAGLVVDAVVGGELVDEVHRLVAGGALGGGSLEGGRHGPLLLVFFFTPSTTIPSYRGKAARGLLQTPQRPALSCCC